jgi:F0F1-type ATP synthase assembly protein I
VGLELAAAVAGFTLAGAWIDRRYGSQPWGVVIGVILGMVGGLYNLVKQSLQASREAQIDAARGTSEDDDGPGGIGA